VTIFFVLSGFLITTKRPQGPIDLKTFYLRRVFRPMPVAWFYLIVIWVFEKAFGIRSVTAIEVIACLLFFRTYVGQMGQGLIAAFWSLSFEAQLYLVWPCPLFFAGIWRARWFAFGGTLACFIYRLLNWAHFDHLYVAFHSEGSASRHCSSLLHRALPRPSPAQSY
jgi:peptidoglycan/LPS O-acetylase OafA/YrhL